MLEGPIILIIKQDPLCIRKADHHQHIVICSIAQSCPTLRPHELQHTWLPHPSLSTRVCKNSCPLSWWCHPTISASAASLSSCPQSLPASGLKNPIVIWGLLMTYLSKIISSTNSSSPNPHNGNIIFSL